MDVAAGKEITSCRTTIGARLKIRIARSRFAMTSRTQQARPLSEPPAHPARWHLVTSGAEYCTWLPPALLGEFVVSPRRALLLEREGLPSRRSASRCPATERAAVNTLSELQPAWTGRISGQLFGRSSEGRRHVNERFRSSHGRDATTDGRSTPVFLHARATRLPRSLC